MSFLFLKSGPGSADSALMAESVTGSGCIFDRGHVRPSAQHESTQIISVEAICIAEAEEHSQPGAVHILAMAERTWL